MEFVPSKTNSIKKQRKDLQIRGPAGTLPLCTSTPPPIDSTSNLRMAAGGPFFNLHESP